VAASPPEVIVRAVGWLIPPAAREATLGDLHEISGGTAAFLGAAFVTIPFVVWSRVLRTSDAVVRLMEAMTLYTSFVLAGRWLEPAILYDPSGFARLAIPPGVVLLTLMLADAYSDPKKRPPLRPIFGPVLGMALAYASQAATGSWALPHILLWYAGGMGIVLVSTLRMTIPPIADRPQLARIPAHWQKLDLEGFHGLARPLIIVAIVVLILLSRFLTNHLK